MGFDIGSLMSMVGSGEGGGGASGGASAGAAIGEAIGVPIGYWASEGDRRRMMDAWRELKEGANEIGQEDPRLKRAQMAALEKMYQTAMQGGMDPQARSALMQAQAATAAAERGARGALIQNAQARGMGGSGAEFLGTLANQQGSATRNNLAGTQAAGDARMRALQAMSGTVSGYGQARGQDLDWEKAKRQVEMFNAQQRMRKAGALSDLYGDRRKEVWDMTQGGMKGGGAAIGAAIGGA